VAAQFTHRIGAGLLTLLIIALFVEARKTRASRPDLYVGSAAAMVLVLCQAITGGIVVLSRLAILSTLAHSFFVALLFGTLAYMAMHTFPLPRPRATLAASPES
jgi:cytochrome c oxidase assembly protein subunit 15